MTNTLHSELDDEVGGDGRTASKKYETGMGDRRGLRLGSGQADDPLDGCAIDGGGDASSGAARPAAAAAGGCAIDGGGDASSGAARPGT